MKRETGLISTSHTIDDDLQLIYKARNDPIFIKDFFYSETHSQVHQFRGLRSSETSIVNYPSLLYSPILTVPLGISSFTEAVSQSLATGRT